MVTGGLIRRLNNFVRAGKCTHADIWRLCYSRIQADRKAFETSQPISALALPGTNSFISMISTNPEGEQHSFGLPIGVKDNFCTNAIRFGVATTCASRALSNFRPGYTATVVDCLEEAGFSLIGKTNMDEFSMGCGSTDSNLTEPVVNPWSRKASDPADRIAGGSSGGSTAAVAAGLCVAALASDTGGSCRYPAGLCGVAGLKPTYGLLSRHGLIPLANSLDTPSLVGLEVTDLADLLAACLRGVQANATRRDSTQALLSGGFLAEILTQLDNVGNLDNDDDEQATAASLFPLRVGVPAEFHVAGLTEEVATAWDTAAGWCADRLGCRVQTVSLPHMPFSCAVYAVLSSAEVASNMARYGAVQFGYCATSADYQSHLDLTTFDGMMAATRSVNLGDAVRSRILAGNYFLLDKKETPSVAEGLETHDHLDAARRMWRCIHDELHRMFRHKPCDESATGVDFLLTPVHLTPAPSINEFCRLDNRTRVSRDDVCTAPVSLAGLPAVVLPVKTVTAESSDAGLPIGLQLVGPPFSEASLLRLARRLERVAQFRPLVDLSTLLT